MKTLSTKFGDYIDRVGIERRYVLKLTDGVDTWYFSNRPTRLDQGTCYPFLTGGFSVKEGFDIYSRRWTTPTLNVSIRNELCDLQGDGTWQRVSDLIPGVRYRDAVLYAAVGPDMSSTADMLVIVDGLIASAPDCSEGKVVIAITDRAQLQNVLLPNTLVSSVYADAPAITQSDVLPLVYGSFTQAATPDANSDFTGLGLSRGIIVRGRTPTAATLYCMAAHIASAITRLWIKAPFGIHPAHCVNHAEGPGTVTEPTLDTDDSGRATGLWDSKSSSGNTALEMYLEFDDVDATGYSIDDHPAPTNAEHMWDKDAATYSDSDSSDYVYMPLRIANGDEMRDHPTLKRAGYYWFVDGIVTEVGTGIAFYCQVFYDYDSADLVTPAQTWAPSASWQHLDLSAGVNYRMDNPVAAVPVMVVIWKRHTTTGANQYIRIYEARLRVYAHKNIVDDDNPVFAEMDGFEFDTWIDTRSTNYNAGDLIQDPVQILHSLLRDVIGLDDTRIDHASFAAAENTNVTARLNLHQDNRMRVYDIARQLAEQSTAAIHVAANGKWRAVDLSDKTPTTNMTVLYTDILADSLVVSKTEDIVNRITVKSRWQNEYDAYRDVDVVNDTTSQTAFASGVFDGIFAAELSWPNICGAVKDLIAAWLVNTTDGIWSKDHTAIQLSLEGWKYIRLDCGDTIELDATSTDPYIRCQGASWSGLQFLITNITYKQDRIIIEAVELY